MNKLGKDDYDMLYWHAVNKMRAGEFHGGAQFLRYVFMENRVFHVGLGLAYCYYRNNQLDEARHILRQLTRPSTDRDHRLYSRLAKRIGGV